MAYRQLALERDLPDEEQEEGLAGSVCPNHEPDAGTAVADAADIAYQSLDLALTPDLNMLKPEPGDDTRAQCADDCIAVAMRRQSLSLAKRFSTLWRCL